MVAGGRGERRGLKKGGFFFPSASYVTWFLFSFFFPCGDASQEKKSGRDFFILPTPSLPPPSKVLCLVEPSYPKNGLLSGRKEGEGGGGRKKGRNGKPAYAKKSVLQVLFIFSAPTPSPFLHRHHHLLPMSAHRRTFAARLWQWGEEEDSPLSRRIRPDEDDEDK